MAKDLSRSSQVLPPVGFLLEAYDGGLNPFRYWGDQPVAGVHCSACCSTLDFDALSRSLDIRGRRHSYWADGRILVSERLRDFFRSAGYLDVDFPCLDAKRRLYELRPSRTLMVDIERSEPILDDFCGKCGNFQCYVRGRGVFLCDIVKPLADGIYRTDLVVGCLMGKHFDIIVGPATRAKLLEAKFSQLSFRPLPDFDPDFENRKADQAKTGARWRRKQRAIERLQRIRARRGCAHGSQPITKPFGT